MVGKRFATLAAMTAFALLVVAAPASASLDSLIFKTICTLKTAGAYPSPQPMDPIVHPGEYPAGHLHEFFGNTTIQPDSTGDQLQADGGATNTTCADRFDTANYWVPEMFRDGVRVPPRLVDVYYRRLPGLTTWDGTPINKVTPPPLNFRMIAGDHAATAPQARGIINWHCRGVANAPTVYPPSCATGQGIGVNITFPNCWDRSMEFTSPDNVNNVAYAAIGSVSRCPAGFSTQVPRLGVEVLYDTPALPDCHLVSSPVDGQNCYVYTLSEVDPATGMVDSQGPIEGMHADFLNGWNSTPDTADSPPLDFASLIDEFLNAPDGSGSSSACVEKCTQTTPPGNAFAPSH